MKNFQRRNSVSWIPSRNGRMEVLVSERDLPRRCTPRLLFSPIRPNNTLSDWIDSFQLVNPACFVCNLLFLLARPRAVSQSDSRRKELLDPQSEQSAKTYIKLGGGEGAFGSEFNIFIWIFFCLCQGGEEVSRSLSFATKLCLLKRAAEMVSCVFLERLDGLLT